MPSKEIIAARSAVANIEAEDVEMLPNIIAQALEQFASTVSIGKIEWSELFNELDRWLESTGDLDEVKAQFADWVDESAGPR